MAVKNCQYRVPIRLLYGYTVIIIFEHFFLIELVFFFRTPFFVVSVVLLLVDFGQALFHQLCNN